MAELKAQAPLPARAHVDHGVGVVNTERHQNKAAGRGCHGASCCAWGFWIGAPVTFGRVKNLIRTPIRTRKAITETTNPHAVVSNETEMSPASDSGSASPVFDSSPNAPTIPTTVPINPNIGGIITPAIEIQMARSQNFRRRFNCSLFALGISEA
jgi:hypothetical protein